tara:strand:+ start:46 stop:561 length:516 start_codon:yes stop_codon:yes gene_type:complete
MSQLKVNSIVPVGGLPSGATGGGIIQTVTNFKDNFFSTASTSYTDVTGFNVTITPSSNSSKILILTCCSQHGNNINTVFSMQLVRGSTNIAVSSDSSSDPIASSMTTHYGSELTSAYNWSYHFIDSPSTTSAVTYKWQVKVNAGTGAINGRSGSSGALGSTSSMTAMEITG